jgi:heme/copper-type cytochrome/quinol oxidase subunit 4
MSEQPESKKQLHLTFVEMLFALAIGQIAIDVSRLIDYQLMSEQTLWAVISGYSHLLLAFVVISTSWVGWRNSRFCGTDIKDVFTLNYIELLADIALVVMYFTLARAVEIPGSPDESLSPNASFEAKAVAVIVTAYLFWDLISCRRNPKEKLTQRLWVSVCCAVIAWFLVLLGIGRSGTVPAVLLADFCLIALILTFRAMKRRDFSKHDKKSWALILFMLVLVVIFLIGSIRY